MEQIFVAFSEYLNFKKLPGSFLTTILDMIVLEDVKEIMFESQN